MTTWIVYALAGAGVIAFIYVGGMCLDAIGDGKKEPERDDG